VDHSIEKEILDQIQRLPANKQQEVLDFARRLARPRGRRIEDLRPFAGSIDVTDLSLMQQAIEDACEQVDPDE